ncbi:MAG: polyprenol monophosphomannose synthase [Chloroflexi bacterium]|nr:polyprenol monophosphomannose synthase [Chloroflexota bacterium]
MVVLPTYNEAENLPALVSAIFDLGIDRTEILVIDDNSPDGTGQIAEELAIKHDRKLRVIHRPGKRGLGTAYVVGFRYALEHGADYVVQMDSDFSHSPKYIPVLLEAAKDHDIAVGSRYVTGGGVDAKWSIVRRMLSLWGNSAYARLILGLQVHDATGGFKCFRKNALAGLDLDRIESQGYAFQIEMAYACQKKGYRVKEVPIVFPDRARGKSKMSLAIALEAVIRVWQIKWRY